MLYEVITLEFFSEYENALLIHFHQQMDLPEKRHAWSRQVNAQLLQIERDVFLAGYPKAFLFFMDENCLCAECPGPRTACKNALQARPSPESFAVDVFETARRQNYTIKVLTDYSQPIVITSYSIHYTKLYEPSKSASTCTEPAKRSIAPASSFNAWWVILRTPITSCRESAPPSNSSMPPTK